jgi:hypothetical protein
LDDAVFRIAATFPTFPAELLSDCRYKMPGDYLYRFDLNAFVQRLIEETGITHTWKPVRIRLEGARCFGMGADYSQDPEIDAKRRARELLWMILERFDRDRGLIPLLASTEFPKMWRDFSLTFRSTLSICFTKWRQQDCWSSQHRDIEGSGETGGKMESMAPLESTKRPKSAPTLGRNRRAISFPHGPLSSGVMPKKDLSNGCSAVPRCQGVGGGSQHLHRQ